MPLHVPTSSKNYFFSFFFPYMSREKQWKNRKKKKTNFSKFLATRTYLKLIFISFFSIFFMNLSLMHTRLSIDGFIPHLQSLSTVTFLYVDPFFDFPSNSFPKLIFFLWMWMWISLKGRSSFFCLGGWLLFASSLISHIATEMNRKIQIITPIQKQHTIAKTHTTDIWYGIMVVINHLSEFMMGQETMAF